MPLKGIAFSAVSNVENVNIGDDNAGESVSVREEFLREVAARLSGANLGALEQLDVVYLQQSVNIIGDRKQELMPKVLEYRENRRMEYE